MRVAFLLILSLLFSSSVRGQERDTDDLWIFAGDILEEAHVRGASIALIRSGQLVGLESFGAKDEHGSAPTTPSTIFEAASLGKVVAAYAALILVDEGRWSLDMPAVSARLQVGANCEGPELRHLLAHAAGLSNQLSATRFRGACHPPVPFSYAGQGFLVLQDLLEADSRKSAEAFIQERVFQPLGMVHSSYAPIAADHTVGYLDLLSGLLAGRFPGRVQAIAAAVVLLVAAVCFRLNQLTWRRRTLLRASATIALQWVAALVMLGAAGSLTVLPTEPRPEPVSLPSSLHTTAEDLARFAQELLRPRLMREATRDLLFAPQVEVDPDIAWGAGIGIDRSTRPTTYWQWGSNPGFQSLLVVEPQRADAIVVLTNRGTLVDLITGRGGYGAAKQIARRALGLDGRWDLYRRAPDS